MVKVIIVSVEIHFFQRYYIFRSWVLGIFFKLEIFPGVECWNIS